MCSYVCNVQTKPGFGGGCRQETATYRSKHVLYIHTYVCTYIVRTHVHMYVQCTMYIQWNLPNPAFA